MITPTEIFISLNCINIDEIFNKIVIDTPTLHKSKEGPVEWITAQPYFPGPKGQKLPIYFQVGKQRIFGISGTWPMGTPKDEQTIDNIDGFQIGYPLTSLKTVDEPTSDELATKKLFDLIWQKTLDSTMEFCKVKKEDRKVPHATFNSYLAAKQEDGNWKDFLKPLYDFTNTEDKSTKVKKPDPTKPLKSYIQFVCFGGKDGKKLRCDTKVRGPADKLCDPRKYFSTMENSIQGDAEVVLLWQDIFYGSHNTKPYGASIRLRVAEMNFSPVTSSLLTTNRFLASNSTPAITEGEEDGGEFEFSHPLNGKSVNSDDFLDGDKINEETLLNANKKSEKTTVREPEKSDEEKETKTEKFAKKTVKKSKK